MSEFVLRQVQLPEDFNSLINLWQNAGPGIGISASDSLPELTKKMMAAPELFLVALPANGDAIVGSVIGGYDGRRGLIYHLAVAPNLRNSGLGSKLLSEIEKRLKELDCKKAYLLVKRGNPQLDAYYEKRDWQAMDDIRLFGKNL